MRRGKPVVDTIAASEARQTWSKLLTRVNRDGPRVVLEEDGVPVAVLDSPADLGWFQNVETRWDERSRKLDALHDTFADVPGAEIEREVARARAEVGARAPHDIDAAAS
jgi:PHD/YefM family antitoxin component YafN of YafNO toxin-antitoxin module